MYLVYILISTKYRKSYVGITNDIERRLKQHNCGYQTYTKRYIPWILIHTERYNTRIEARTREKYLKSSAGRRWMKINIFGELNARVAELADAQS